MITSMTGFARCDATHAAGQLRWELRSVNHRYLELSLRLPEPFRPLEEALRKAVSSRLGRGKVDATLHFTVSEANSETLALNEELAGQLLKHAGTLADGHANAAPVNMVDVLRWPGVLTHEPVNAEVLNDPVKELMNEAVDLLYDTRAREGERIYAMLDTRLTEISDIVNKVRMHYPDALDAVREKIRGRAADLDVTLDDGRLEQELVMLAQKMDIAEELDRLDAHVSEFRDTLAKNEPVGRRLDFLLQEFNREANTLGSKASDTETTNASVDLKVLIEQMREQVQNVE